MTQNQAMVTDNTTDGSMLYFVCWHKSEGFTYSEHKPQEHSWTLISVSEIHR